MPPEPLLTSAGWSLNGLLIQGHRFREIPRVSVSDKNLDATIRNHESSGVPLVIEGMHEHQAWPTAMFDIQWLRDNLKQQIQVRNVRNRRDLDVSFAEFLEHIKSINRYASADETSRWYAKDMECPCEWKEWLDKTSLVPHSLRPHGPADIMQDLPEQARVETLMCYLGIGDTFTPCHKDLCASFGHNLMCYAEDGASAFWFMTESSAAPLMAKHFQSLGHELDLESHTMSIEEFATAPCNVYITEQKAGDLVLVPPKSCHQVVNHGSLTVKMSWSRMTIRSTQIALHEELPIYRRVCRVETYRIKSTIHHTLRRKIVLLENMWRKDNCAGYHDIFRVQLANDVQKLLELFREVILEECCPDAETLDHVIRDFSHNVYDSEGYPAFSCDFCGSDIFVSFFCCRRCSPSAKCPSSISDGLHICPGCCVEGRSCGCGGLMEPVQCWPLQILYGDYDRAVRALKAGGVDVFDEVADCEILNNNVTSVFEAGIAIQQWRAEVNKGGSLCHANLAQPHAVHNTAILHCKKCRKGHCFVHLAEAGIHSSEAITLYKKSQEQSTWHEFHLSKTTSPDQETILAAEASGDDVSNLIGQKRATVALSFSHCQPLNNTPHIKPGWYDKPKSSGVATLGSPYAMDMSNPRDGGDWGSEDSFSNTVVGSETPPGESEHAKARSSVPATVQYSTDVAIDSMKRKRTSLVFDGVAPPERRRRTSARNSESPPSAGLVPRSATSVKGDEKSQGPRSTQSSTAVLESSHLQAMIDTLTSKVVAQDRKLDELAQDNRDLRDRIRNLSQTLHAAQNKKFDVLVQGNAHLRDELRHLSQTVQSSKKDIQRVENISNNMASELKGKFEYMLEKSENRILGPINRLSDELEKIRANPPAPPVPVPSSTAFPSTAPYPPEPPPGDGEWTSPDDYTPAESNKPHYQESWGNYRQPNHKYGRGGFRPYRRGRGSRGGYPGNRQPNQGHCYTPNPDGWGQPYRDQAMPFTPAAAPPEPAPTPEVHPASDMYHSQGFPPPQSPHTSSSSHSHPHPTSSPSTHPRPYSHAHGNVNTRARPTSPVLATTAPPAPSSQPNSHRPTAHPPPVYEHKHEHARPRDYHQFHAHTHHPQPHQPPPRSHEWRQTPASVPAPAQAQATADDGSYGADSTYTVRSPTPSDRDGDEQVRWTPTPITDSVPGGGQRRHGRGRGHHNSQSQSHTSSPSRNHVGHGHNRHTDEGWSGGWR